VDRSAAELNWVIRSFTFLAAGPTAVFTFQNLVFNADLNGIPNVILSPTYLDDFKISTPGCNTGV
jgi:hypothetical protein